MGDESGESTDKDDLWRVQGETRLVLEELHCTRLMVWDGQLTQETRWWMLNRAIC